MSEPVTLPETDSAHEQEFLRRVRDDLDRSCAALDGHTLSRLNRIRHEALERRHQGRRTPMLLPFGGLVTACVLVLSVMLNDGGVPTESSGTGTAPLEDLELLTSSEELDFYENYEFYQWLADSSI